MNTTQSNPNTPVYVDAAAYIDTAARELKVGDSLIHGKTNKLITGLTLVDDGYVTIRWDGGMTMCEPSAPVRIQVK